MKPIFAPDHNGMKVDSSGILVAARAPSAGLRFMRQEMHKHLEEMARRYYAGDVAVVDEFCQLYCLGEKERKAAKENV